MWFTAMGFTEECGRVRKSSDAIHADCYSSDVSAGQNADRHTDSGHLAYRISERQGVCEELGYRQSRYIMLKKSRYILSEFYGL